jgi:hypothetical protein|tara:strand:- start:25 stop:204 length:180 start_codon:yes stop_codon:yes gene_type:complete
MNNIKTVHYVRKELDNSIINLKVTDTNDMIHFVPMTTKNIDYVDVLAWVEDGNTIQEAD